MWDLRWVLLGLGALLLVGLYLWSRGLLRLPELRRSGRLPAADEGMAGSVPPPAVDSADEPGSPASGGPATERGARAAPERVIALRIVPKGTELPADGAVLALRAAGLEHGRYGIFHRPGAASDPWFSIANLTEPGTFDLTTLTETTIAGLTVFMVLPGSGDPVERFDAMIETARALAVRLGADLLDERGSSWSVQRERYIREEIIEYRHQSGRN